MKNADWGKWSAIAEIVSSVAIVVTLVYLTVQTQQNTSALLAVSRQAALQAELDVLSLRFDYPQLWLDQGELSPEDEVRYTGFVYKILRMREFEWFQYQSGILDQATWQSYMAPMRGIFALKRARDILENMSAIQGSRRTSCTILDEGSTGDP